MSEMYAPTGARSKSYFWRFYVLSWAVLAAGALGYLSIFALNSEQGRLLSNPLQSNQESNRAELDRARLTAQVRSLNKTVASLRGDLARMKAPEESNSTKTAEAPRIITPRPVPTQIVQSSGAEPDRELARTSNVTTSSIGQAKSDETAVQEAPVAPRETAVTKPRVRGNGRNLATAPLQAGGLPPLPVTREQRASAAPRASVTTSSLQPRLLNGGVAPKASRIQTGSLPVATPNVVPTPVAPVAVRAPTPLQFGQPKVQPRKSSAALSLSSASSVTGLRASWLLLTTRHGNVFSRFSPRYVSDPASGTYRLLAGPISNRAEADRVCTELRAQSVNCGVTDFIGSPL